MERFPNLSRQNKSLILPGLGDTVGLFLFTIGWIALLLVDPCSFVASFDAALQLRTTDSNVWGAGASYGAKRKGRPEETVF
jgi:hypothetical protein